MPRALNFTLSESELELVAKAVKTDKRPEVRQRAMGLRLLHAGHPPKEVAEIMSVSQPVVYDCDASGIDFDPVAIRRCRSLGLSALAHRPKSGSTSKSGSELCRTLGSRD